MASLELIAGGTPRGALPLPESERPQVLYLLLEGDAPRLDPAAGRPPAAPAALLYARRRWVVLVCSTEAEVKVNGIPVVAFRILDHGDLLETAGLALRLAEEEEETLAAGSPLVLNRQRCLFCRRPFEVGDRVVLCPVCKGAHHTACLAANRGRCANNLCDYISKPRAAARRAGGS
jgi:hypothetical protein